MPVTLQDIEAQRNLVQQSGAKATQTAGVGSDFLARVKEELRQRAAAKGQSQLAQAAVTARQNFAAFPAQAREEYQDIDPFRRMALIAQQRGDMLGEIENISQLQQEREAGVQDILQLAKQGLDAEAEKAAREAALQQQQYQNMWDEYKFAQQLALDYAQLAASQAGSVGGGLDITDFNTMANQVADELHSGKVDWGDAFNYLKSIFPNVPDQVIDARLGIKWREPGAYEQSVRESKAASISQSDKNKVDKLQALVGDIDSLLTGFGQPPGISQFVTGPTGPLAQIWGAFGAGGQLRQDLGNFEAGVKYGRYGGALTETEVKEYGKWGPSAGRQETANIKRLTALRNSKLNELYGILDDYGLKPEDIGIASNFALENDDWELVSP